MQATICEIRITKIVRCAAFAEHTSRENLYAYGIMYVYYYLSHMYLFCSVHIWYMLHVLLQTWWWPTRLISSCTIAGHYCSTMPIWYIIILLLHCMMDKLHFILYGIHWPHPSCEFLLLWGCGPVAWQQLHCLTPRTTPFLNNKFCLSR